MSELLALGISHKTAPVALRERLAFTETRRAQFAKLRRLESAEVREAVVISTCNRTEVYLVVGDPVRAEADVLGAARPARRHPPDGARRGDLLAAQLRRRAPALPRHRGARVDDLGEAEIQGQVKRAYEAAIAAGTTGPLSNRLFAAALTTGKRVRAETGIGDKPRERPVGGRRSRPRACSARSPNVTR